jgi:hypothetical protein
VGRSSRQRMGHSFRRAGQPRLVSSQSHNSLKHLAMEMSSMAQEEQKDEVDS